MTTCRAYKKKLIHYFQHSGSINMSEQLENHLNECHACSGEFRKLNDLSQLIKETDQDCDQVIATYDWDLVASSVVSRVNRETGSTRHKKFGKFFFSHTPRGLGLAFASLVIIGIGIGYFLFYSGNNGSEVKPELPSRNSIYTIQSVMDKKDVVDYLKKSQLVLTDLLKQCDGGVGDSEYLQANIRNARVLLGKTRYLNRDSQNTGLLSSQALLRKIEWLLFEIVSLGRDISCDELHQLQLYIEKERLLLKIRLIERELQQKNQRFIPKQNEV